MNRQKTLSEPFMRHYGSSTVSASSMEHKYVLVVVDMFSKGIEIFPLQESDSEMLTKC